MVGYKEMNKPDSHAECAAVIYPPIRKAEEGWLMVMENFAENEKLTVFLDYYIKKLMENRNDSIEMWNINMHWHRTKGAVEVWNSKLNSIIRKQQPKVFLQVQNLKEESELVSWQLKSKEAGQRGQKRKKRHVKKEN
jgi:hypothetical protein